MMTAAATAPRKWRPHLRTVILAILLVALMLPLVGLFFFRVYENQLIRQTEAELIAQSAALAAAFAVAVERSLIPENQRGVPAPEQLRPDPDEPYAPIEPRLDLAVDAILPRRADALAPAAPPAPAWRAIGQRLAPLLVETQRITLAGFRLLDPSGTVIAGRNETGLSLAHIPEVQTALAGAYASTLRIRVSDQPPPSLYSISRGTRVRVFVAMPVIAGGRIAGVVYASRTPSNIVRHLYGERGKLVLAALVVIGAALVLAFVAARTITRPLLELTRRTRAIAAGDDDAMKPLTHHGTREVAELAQAFLAMARRLKDRTAHVETFAAHVSHELKSPLTAIQGAAALIRDSETGMDAAERKRFLDNIIADTERLSALTRRLLELARAEAERPGAQSARLEDVLPELRDNTGLALRADGDTGLALAISAENLLAVLGHLADNAARHGATQLEISMATEDNAARIAVADNGSGISAGNRARIFDPFFTTRRAEGGTGMGLGIVRALLEAHGGTIELADAAQGTTFLLFLPLAGGAEARR